MKTRLVLAALAFAAATLFAVPASAQSVTRPHEARVPFTFHVGNAVLPAGEYRFTLNDGCVQIRSLDGHAGAIARAIPAMQAKTAESTYLKFTRRDGELYLTNVFFGGSNDGVEFRPKIRAASRMQ